MSRTIKKASVLMSVLFVLLSATAFAKGKHRHDATSYFFLKKTDYRLEQAIQQLEQENKGKVVAAKVEMDDELLLYELKRIEGDSVMEILIDPKTKTVVETSKEGIFSRYDDEEDIKAANKTKLSLTQAMEIAGKQSNGVIVAAHFSNKNQQSIYRIHVVTNRGSFKILVDSETGETFQLTRDHKKGSKKHKRDED